MEEAARLPHMWFDTPSPHEPPLTQGSRRPSVAEEPTAAYLVDHLGDMLSKVPDSRRTEVAQLLTVYTTSGGDKDYAARLCKLLTTSEQ